MSEKQYYKFLDDKQEWVIRDKTNRRNEFRVGRNKRYTEKIVDLLNDLSEENEQLRTQLLICQQSKKDDGRFQVWEVPPIQKGMRIKISTGEKDE